MLLMECDTATLHASRGENQFVRKSISKRHLMAETVCFWYSVHRTV